MASAAYPAYRFDSGAGVAYTETVCRKPYIDESWIWHESYSLRYKKELNGSWGARSLRELAIQTTCSKRQSLEPASFSNVPWSIAKDIWLKLVEEYAMLHSPSPNKRTKLTAPSGLDDFGAWRIFVQAYGHEPGSSPILGRSNGFTNITDTLKASQCLDFAKRQAGTWLSHLNLYGASVSRSDLARIPELLNLRQLMIWSDRRRLSQSGEAAKVDDRIIRAWSDAVDEAGAFRQLTTLALVYQSALGPYTSFANLANFPALVCIGTDSFGPASVFATPVKQRSWKHVHGGQMSSADLALKVFSQQMLEHNSLKPLDSRENGESWNDEPCLQFSLDGRPDLWTAHIEIFRRVKSADTDVDVSSPRHTKKLHVEAKRSQQRKVKDSKLSDVASLCAGLGFA